MADAMDQLEPGVETAQADDGNGGYRFLNPGECIRLSQAISLKRIADTFATLSTEVCNDYGETILPAITRAISNGIAGR